MWESLRAWIVALIECPHAAASRELEQCRVQLAGCGVAAQGGTDPEQVAEPGDYGWSCSYAAVLALRLEVDRLREAVPRPVHVQERLPLVGQYCALDCLDGTYRFGQWNGEAWVYRLGNVQHVTRPLEYATFGANTWQAVGVPLPLR